MDYEKRVLSEEQNHWLLKENAKLKEQLKELYDAAKDLMDALDGPECDCGSNCYICRAFSVIKSIDADKEG